jgi:calpain-15
MMRPDRIKSWETFVWKRASDYFKKKTYYVFNNISPTDIKQGYCGDCYYLSALSSLAENKDRVKWLFITTEVNSAGCYAIQFYINGEPIEVVVDD